MKILLVTVGHAGHVIPLFELAKVLHEHDITFVTQQVAQVYVDFKSHPNPSKFHLHFTTDSKEELVQEKEKEIFLITHAANSSLFNSLGYTMKLMIDDSAKLFNSTIHRLMSEKFDLIIGNSALKYLHVISSRAKIPCVMQSTEILPNPLDFNAPNYFSGLSKTDMKVTVYRLFNFIFNIRLIIGIAKTILPIIQETRHVYPKIAGPYEDIFSIQSLLTAQSKCLHLMSIPPTLFPVGFTDPYTKYLGAFINQNPTADFERNELSDWIVSKPDRSVIYGAFGTSSLIHYDRMRNLIDGLTKFLSEHVDVSLLLVLRGNNYDVYQQLLANIDDEAVRAFLTKSKRIRIENRFVPQKWILKQTSVRLFLSHCGMGSTSEAIFFGLPILCMPFNMDQFINAMAIEQSFVGLSLFVRPGLFYSFIHPHNFQGYKFTGTFLYEQLVEIWKNPIFAKSAYLMSLEVQHAGGLDQAVREIEYFTKLDGNFDRYTVYSATLPFYQRYFLDIFLVYFIVPYLLIRYLFKKLSKKSGKKKLE